MKVLLLLIIFQLISDISNINECVSVSGKILLILHHILQVYILYGGYFFNSRVHITVLVLSFAVHYLHHKICPITVVNNHICGFPKNQQLHTMLNVIEPNRTHVICVYYFLLTIAFLYDLFKINQGK